MNEQILPGGVRYEALWWCDFFEGTKEALIAGGHAPAAWFPAAPVAYPRRGRVQVKRTFRFLDELGREVRMNAVRKRWTLWRPISDDEKERRNAQARRRAGEFSVERSQSELERVAQRAFAELGDMAGEELERVLVEAFGHCTRRQQLVIAGLARSLAEESAPRSRLRLVVDNDRG
jgi:hypothetical protein